MKETCDYLRFLDSLQAIIDKAPSAVLFDEQTDENEMGVSYNSIESYLLGADIEDPHWQIIEHHHQRSVHKRNMLRLFKRK